MNNQLVRVTSVSQIIQYVMQIMQIIPNPNFVY